jgi:hypothetical protein
MIAYNSNVTSTLGGSRWLTSNFRRDPHSRSSEIGDGIEINNE